MTTTLGADPATADATRTDRGAVLARDLAVAGVTGAIALHLVSTFVGPSLPDGGAERLAAVVAHPVRLAVAHAAFLASEPATMGAALGVAHLLRRRSTRLGIVGAFLLILGSAGDAVSGAAQFVLFAAAGQAPVRVGDAALVDAVTALPAFRVFALVGLAATVAGTLVLSIGLLRGRVGPRWVAPVLWGFLLVEFVGSSVVDQLSYLSVLLVCAAYAALGREMLKRW